MSRMIPLKIADMAVAACNEEIAKHLLEIGRLQGRVIALEAQLESERAIAKALRSMSFTTAVPSEDYEKLKANLEKSDAVVFKQAVENMRLQADVERIRKAGDELAKRTERLAFLLNNAYLDKERLGKAGDAMLLALWLGVDEYSKEQKEKAEEVWNAAKEGKQSV